jgi:hypothetical protein
MLAGTMLLTPQGYRPIETLRRGDLIGTLIGRGPMFTPVTWIGRRPAASAAEIAPEDHGAIRIRHNAIGDGMPNRDLWLAPGHALYLQGGLYLARQLVNQRSILFNPDLRDGDYWAVQLERHDIILADNLPVESLLPAGATFFAEVTQPRLVVVAEPPPAPAESAATLQFPSTISMSVRWFRRRIMARPAAMLPAPVSNPPDTAAPSADGSLLVQAEARTVLDTFTLLASQRGLHLQTAVESGLTVRIDRNRLHELLGGMLTHAIHSAAGGRVLLGAMRHAGRIQIAVIDEDGSGDQASHEADLRQVAELAALQGATLEVDVRPGEGTTILLRLLAA